MSLPHENPTRNQLADLRKVREKIVMRAQAKVIAAQGDLIAAQARLQETDEALAVCPDAQLDLIAHLRTVA